MHTATLTPLALSLVALASAQQNYVINPDTVSNATRQFWCDQQQTQCPLICLQSTTGVPRENDCTASSLTYACVCSDGISPNLTQYSQTLPFFVCQEWGNQCVSNCGGDAGCASSCRADHPCGAQHPFTGNASATSSATQSASATAGGSNVVHTGFAGQGGSSSGGSDGSDGPEQQDNGAVGLGMGSAAGWAVLFAGFVGGFAAVL